MEHSDRYEWIRVEADDAGCLDDIVALCADGSWLVRQVKFSTHPASSGDPWTWSVLLKIRQGKKGPLPSLLAKWYRSWEQLRRDHSIREAALLSNRRAAPELALTLSPSGLVDFEKIEDAEVRADIVSQLGSEEGARAFLGDFHFYVDRQGLVDLESAVRQRFHALGGTDQGWLSLKDEMRTWVRDRSQPPPEGHITLAMARRAALWYSLQSLPQRFEVPRDYVLPWREFHDGLVADLLALKGGCLVITAPPGLGKSTYLSYLVAQLQEQSIPVVRHHYFLSLTDRSGDRLSRRTVAESLMSDLRTCFPEALGAKALRNPSPDELGQWLDTAGRYFADEGKPLTVIVDGLDHVLREGQSLEELNALLRVLLPPPEGVVILVGTQPLDDAQLPSSLLRAAPRSEWYDLPGLDRSAVRKWLEYHDQEIGLPSPERRDFVLDSLTDAFFSKSQGHPLHLRYTLSGLLERGLLVTPQNVNSLPGCPHHDIESYYQELWRALPEGGREILHLLASCRFVWPRPGIIDCLDPQAHRTAMVNTALRSVAHLTMHDQLGIRPFHNSLLVFVENQPDHEDYAPRMKRLALDWLSLSAPEYLRWAHEWRLRADLGESEALINGPDRDWAVDAIVRRYPRQEMQEILARSSWAALDRDDVARYLRVALLRDYSNDAYEFRDSVVETLLYPQLVLLEDPSLTVRLASSLSTLRHGELATLARYGSQLKDQKLVERVFHEANERLRSDRASRDEWDARVQAVLQTAALCEQLTPRPVSEYVLQYRDQERSDSLLAIYCRELRRSRDMLKMRQLLELDVFDEKERDILVRTAVLMALEQPQIDLIPALPGGEVSEPFEALYMLLRGSSEFELSPLDFPSVDLVSSGKHEDYFPYPAKQHILHHAFFCFLVNHLGQHADRNEAWLERGGSSSWPARFLHRLDRSAGRVAALIAQGDSPRFSLIFEEVQQLSRPSWSEDRHGYAYAVGAERALGQIAMDIMALAGTPEISQADVEMAVASGYCDSLVWIETYLEYGRPWLTDDAVKWLLSREEPRLRDVISTFTDRASGFSLLAALAAFHTLKVDARRYIQQAASSLLGYGDHKDYLLFGVLEMISDCHSAGFTQARQWLLQVSPLIAYVTDFTDGDETAYLPKELSQTLATVAPDLLPRYHEWLLRAEQYDDALHAFHTYIRTADLSSAANQALAKTAVDQQSLGILTERSERGEEGAKSVLSALSGYLGGIALAAAKRDEIHSIPSLPDPSDVGQTAPDPADYPPEQLTGFLKASRGSYNHADAHVLEWLRYWASEGRSEDVLSAMEVAVERGVELDIFDDIFDLATSLFGVEQAYPWLVRAHVRSHGWHRYFAAEEDSTRRWRIIREQLPDRWRKFMKDTIVMSDRRMRGPSGHGRFERIVRYCLFMTEEELAKQVAQETIDFTLESVLPLQLPIPEWVPPHDKSSK